GGEVAQERLPEPERQTHRNRKNQEDESALDDKISCAPFQQYRNVHYAMLHHRVGEGEGKQKKQEHTHEGKPEGNEVVKALLGRPHGYDRSDSHCSAPEN